MKRTKPSFRSKEPQKQDLWVTGNHAVLEQLRQNATQVLRIVYRDEICQKNFEAELRSASLPLPEKVFIDPELKDRVQALVDISTVDIDTVVENWQAESRKVIIALDHVTDPRNLGAIVRSAAFFGIQDILVAKDRQVLLTPAAVSTAQGGFAVTRLVTCTNLARTLVSLKEHGFWVLGCDAGGVNMDKQDLAFDKSILVLGAEGEGLSTNITKKCDSILSIPGGGHGFDSLNVSVAAGIVMYEFLKKFESSAAAKS